MAVTFTGAGTAVAASGASPQAVTTATALAVGDYLVALFAYDNSGGGGADPMTGNIGVAPVTGAVGGVTSTQVGFNDPGAASAGLCTRCQAYPVTTAIPSGTVVNVSWTGTVVVRAVAFMKVTSLGATGYRANSGSTGTNAAANPAFVTPSITSGEGVLCWAGHEYGAAVVADADTTNGSWSTVYGTFTGSLSSGMAAYFQSKVVTATATQTWNPTGNTTDWVVGCLIFTETITPVLTQASYRFYAEGTEAGSTALEAQNTAVTASIDAGDANLHLRIRLQSGAVGTLPATDDYQLQFEKNSSGTWFDAISTGVESMVVNYDESNRNSQVSIFQPAATGTGGMTQQFVGNGQYLTKAGFWLAKVGAPTGGFTARLWSTQYVVGGEAQASTFFQLVQNLNTTPYQWIEFAFDGTYFLTAGTWYYIGFTPMAAWTSTDNLAIGIDSSSPTGPGAQGYFVLGPPDYWSVQSGTDLIFRLWTRSVATTVLPYNSANLTDAAATTNRLGAGSGSFVAGKVTEDGLVDNFTWTGNNYTELLFPITLKQADLIVGDTLKFRVVRNAGTTGFTYTQVPQISIVTGAAPPSITQAAYQFFDDAGTESGAAALAAQNTPVTGNLVNGDGYGQIRVLLQSTSAVDIDAADDFKLQWEKNASGTWNDANTGAVVGYDSPTLTEGAATTSRLTGGTGSYSAGKVSEAGNVANIGWAGNNYTEILYSVRLVAAQLADGDTLRFRVIRNNATTGMTYTQTPTIPIKGPVLLAGSTDGLAASSATLAVDVPLAATSGIGSSSTTAALAAARPLVAVTAVGLSTTTAALDVVKAPIELVANAGGLSTVTGAMVVARALTVVTPAGSSTAAATTMIAARGLTSVAPVGTSTAAGSVLSKAIPIAATATATGTSTATATTLIKSVLLVAGSTGLSSFSESGGAAALALAQGSFDGFAAAGGGDQPPQSTPLSNWAVTQGELLIVGVGGCSSNATQGDPYWNLTGGGLTWARRAEARRPSGTYQASAAIFTTTATATTTITDLVASTTTKALTIDWGRVKVTGFNTSTPVGATAAVADDSNDGSKDITLSALPDPTSVVWAVAFVNSDDNRTGKAIDHGASQGWAETFDYPGSAQWHFGNFEGQRKDSPTSTTVHWDDLKTAGQTGNVYTFAGCAIEVKAGAGGPGFVVARGLGGDSNGLSTATAALDVALPAGGPVDLAGSAVGTSTTTSALIRVLALGATVTGTSTATASTALITRGLVGSSGATSTATATTLARSIPLTALTVPGSSTTTGTLSVGSGFIGFTSGLATTTGALIVARPLTAPAVAGTSTTAAALAAARPLAAASAIGVSTTTAALAVGSGFVGSATGASTTTGALIVAWTLTAPTVGGTSTTTGALARAVPLAATATGGSTTTAAMATADALVASAAGVATTTGALVVARAFIASAAGISSTNANLGASAAGGMASFVPGTSTTTGALGVNRSLVGSASGISTATAITVAKSLPLAATTGGLSTTAATAGVARPLVGSATGTSTTTGSFVGAVSLVGSASGIAATTASLARAVPLVAASAIGGSTTTAAVRITLELAGSSVGLSTATAAARAALVLAGSSAGTSVAFGSFVGSVGLQASASGVATSTGALARAVPLAAIPAIGGSTTTAAARIARGLDGSTAGLSTTIGIVPRIALALEASASGLSTATATPFLLVVGLAGSTDGVSDLVGDLLALTIIPTYGMWQGREFDAMQYGDKEVVELMLTPP